MTKKSLLSFHEFYFFGGSIEVVVIQVTLLVGLCMDLPISAINWFTIYSPEIQDLGEGVVFLKFSSPIP